MAVPLQNVYYLLCYAWDRLEARDLLDVGDVKGNRAENLLGKVLQHGVAHLIRRGIDRGYIEFDEEGRRLRGKLLLSETVGRALLPRGLIACRTDELSYDVPHNRVIKAAMRALIGIPELERKTRTALRDHCLRLHTVTDVELTPAAFRKVQLHRNIAHYRFLVNVAHLVSRSFMPDEGTGRMRFNPFNASEQEMGHLFEAFVRNFLRREQSLFDVSKSQVKWSLDALGSSDPIWLPKMETDVMLTSPVQRVVIETKFVASPYQSRFESKKLKSSHLYQLLTYLAQLGGVAGPKPMGVLLYAGVGEEMRLHYRLDGHRILVRSLDLNRDWHAIHQDLLGLASELEGLADERVSA